MTPFWWDFFSKMEKIYINLWGIPLNSWLLCWLSFPCDGSRCFIATAALNSQRIIHSGPFQPHILHEIIPYDSWILFDDVCSLLFSPVPSSPVVQVQGRTSCKALSNSVPSCFGSSWFKLNRNSLNRLGAEVQKARDPRKSTTSFRLGLRWNSGYFLYVFLLKVKRWCKQFRDGN